MKNRSLAAQGRALNVMAAAAMFLFSTGAAALGVGRVNVQSVLGEPLRAEIEVTSLSPEESASLQVTLASAETFKASGVDFNPVLAGAQVSLARRADGRPVLQLSSNRVVQEPFVDVIVEFAWATGQLTRSYTLLIDPPNRTAAAAAAQAAPVAPVFSPMPMPMPMPAPTTPASEPITIPAPAPVQEPAPMLVPAPATPAIADTPESVPTPAPFADPYAMASDAPPQVEQDFLSAAPGTAPAQAEQPPPFADDPPPPPAPRSRAKKSSRATTEGASGDASREAVKVRPGDTLSSIAAEHNRPGVSLDQMLVSLYRNNPQAFIEDNMNRMKSGASLAVPSTDKASELSPDEARQIIKAQSADFTAYRQRLAAGVPSVRTDEGKRQASGKVEAKVLDQKTGAASNAPEKLTLSRGSAKPGALLPEDQVSKESQRKAEAARVAELSRNVAELKKLSAGAAAATGGASSSGRGVAVAGAAGESASAPAQGEAMVTLPGLITTPTSTTTAASAPGSSDVIASAPVEAPALPPSAAASVPHEPVSESRGFWSMLTDKPFVLPGIATLLVLLGGFVFWRKKGGARKFSGETSFLESKIQPDSFFGASGGQRVDTREGAPNASSSLNYSLSQLDAIGDVDPVAEADVYLAYGRDLQAEEILKEAQRADGDRLAIRTKLLEVYAKRADLRTFESQARQIQAMTNGQGEDWARAQELGRQIDPRNPLYRHGDELGTGTAPLPLRQSNFAEQDIPLDMAALIRPPASQAQPDFAPTDLPIEFEGEAASPPPPQALAEATVPVAAPAVVSAPRQDNDSFDVSDFRLDDAPEGLADPASGLPATVGGEVDDLTLDLNPSPDQAAELAAVAAAEGEASSAGDSEPMARKIELADEFRRIGDHEGARELLEEVVSKADAPLRNRAQTMLDALG